LDEGLMVNILLSPPIALVVFIGILSLFYRFIRKHAAKGKDHPEKHLPYSGGQKIPPREVRLSYNAFFRLALLFSVTHVAVLVLATLSIGIKQSWVGLLFLVGVSISIFVLGQTK
jgi:NADH:ubiquinone oxidoreductase subunit 3 (subunit A)